MPKIWLMSDTHFGHNNIITYCGRPHNHDALMWQSLSNKVQCDDTLIHCGDVCFATKKTASKAKEVFEWLPGKKKILIKGNHDRKETRKQLWDEVHDTYRFVYSDVKFHIQHFPFEDSINLPDADVCIHGHTHNLGQRYTWVDNSNKLVVNMCVEHWNYSPVCIDELVNEYKARLCAKNKKMNIS